MATDHRGLSVSYTHLDVYKRQYWAFYVGDEYASLGVDQTPIADGDSFSLVYTVG